MSASQKRPILIIACGALAKELVAIVRMNQWQHVEIQCLPAELHNTPEKIPASIKTKLDETAGQYATVFVAYADCGTGGQLDSLLAEYGVERLAGAHCYEFFAGRTVFQQLAEAEVGSFYLTDFLVRHFDRLVVKGLGLDRHPELLCEYFRNYNRVVYLAQSESIDLQSRARHCANLLGLSYSYHFTGLGSVETALKNTTESVVTWQN
jgi:Protein of unknown function (DUF1638)